MESEAIHYFNLLFNDEFEKLVTTKNKFFVGILVIIFELHSGIPLMSKK